MAREDTYIIKLEAETGQVDKAVEKVGKNLDGVGKKGESAMGLLDTATAGATGKLSSLYSGFKSAKAGVQSFNLGLKGTKAALISTGIGAFIVLLGEVIANWETITGFFKDKTRENALQREVDLLGQAVSKGKERLAIAQARKAEAAETFKLQEDNLKTEVRLLEKEVKLAKNRGDAETLLEKQNALKDKQLELTILQTQRETEVNELLDKSAQYLDPALKAQREKEQLVAAERDRLKEIEAEIYNIQISQEGYARAVKESAGNTKQQQYWTDRINTDQQRLNELLPQQALLQDTINAKVAEYEQLKEAQAEAEKQRQREERKRRREERKREQEEFDQAFKELEDEFEDELELEEDFFEAQGDLIMGGFKREQELAAAKQAALDAEVASTLAALDEISTAEQEAYNEKEQLIKEERQLISDTNDMRVKMAVQSFQAIEALGKAFASKDEKDAEKSFKVQKALNLASATMGATESVIQAFKTAQTSPYTIINPAYPFIQAGIAAAFGVAQVATIARTQFESPAQPNAGGYGGGGATGSAPGTAPQLDLGFLGAGGGQTGFRSYVIASEVSNSQQANQRINDQASLIG